MNPTASYAFTIIVPLFNERENLERLAASLSAFLPECAVKPACVLLVDDGSTDGSGALVEELCRRHPDFFYLRFDRNRGLSAALKAGFDTCRSSMCGRSRCRCPSTA